MGRKEINYDDHFDPSNLTFTWENWNVSQLVRVHAESCRVGHNATSPLCGHCLMGFRKNMYGECMECPEQLWHMSFNFGVLASVLCIFLAHTYREAQHTRTRLKFRSEHVETRFQFKFRIEQKRRHEQREKEKKRKEKEEKKEEKQKQ